MKNYKLNRILVLIFVLIIMLSACSRNKENTIYINNEYEFSIEFPESWSGEFEVVPYEHGLTITSEVNEIDALAYINKYTTQEWKDLNYGLDIPVKFQILGENIESVFILIYPGDVNYNIKSENSIKKYEEMTGNLEDGKFTFNLIN